MLQLLGDMMLLMRLGRLAAVLLAADLLWTWAGNVKDALVPGAAALPKDGLPVSPEFAFGWLQVLVNGGMVLTVLWGLWVLVCWQAGLRRGVLPRAGVLSVLGVLVVGVFALPSLWTWGGALWGVLQGRDTVSFASPRYVLAAVCQPVLLLCWVQVLWRYWQVRRGTGEDAGSGD